MVQINKIFKIILVFIVVVLAFILCYIFLFNQGKRSVVKVEVVDNIEYFGYNLHDNDTKIYKNNFEELKKVLNEEKIDYEKYASLVSKLFVISFYTLDNKVTNHDIGGTDFIHSDYISMFREKAKNGIYKYIESDVYGDRKQVLPIVSDVEIDSIKKAKFSYENIVDNEDFSISLSVKYEKDLDYPNKVSLVLVHNDKLLQIVEVK